MYRYIVRNVLPREMRGFTLLFFSFTCFVCLALAGEDAETGKTPPMQEWLDPGDMIHYDTDRVQESSTTDCDGLQMKLSQCYKDLVNVPQQCQPCSEKTVVNASPCDTPYFKKVARSILGNIEDYGKHEVVITASKDNVATLERFLTSGDGNVQDVCEVIIGVISNFKKKGYLYEFGQWDTPPFGFLTKEALLILAAIFFLICAAVIFERRTNLTWRSQFWFVIFLSFVISIPWEWYHLYRRAFASKQAQMAKDIPKQCQPDHELRPLESLGLWLRNSFTFSDDLCVKYQEMLLVDPAWEVSPSKAISATIASVIAQPFEHIAEAIGKSFRALFREVPLQWQPFVFIAVIIIIVIAMFTLSGLQVRLPFMTITTAPALPGNFHADLRRLENQVQNVGAAIQRLNQAAEERDAIEHIPLVEDIRNQQRQIMQILNAMNEQQRRGAQPAIQGAVGQHEQGAVDPVERGANVAGAEEERPERTPVMETPKVKFPVQNSEENTMFNTVEDVGRSEET